METPNSAALAARLAALGVTGAEIARAFRGINCAAEAFRHVGERSWDGRK
jgi:hypothetical protein